MHNSQLMGLLKQVNQNHTQRKCLYLLGGLLIASSIGLIVFYNGNKKAKTANNSLNELNSRLTLITKEQQDKLIKKEHHIQKLINDNQALQRAILTGQVQPSSGEIKS